jgi:hypothetical protein
MSGDVRPGPATEVFVAHRNLLFTVAYEMLGSAADAEDVLQETWLRWAAVDLDTVRDQRAYLVRITTRQALTRLRTLGRRKESYVGTWLPEPLLTAPDVAAGARGVRLRFRHWHFCPSRQQLPYGVVTTQRWLTHRRAKGRRPRCMLLRNSNWYAGRATDGQLWLVTSEGVPFLDAVRWV